MCPYFQWRPAFLLFFMLGSFVHGFEDLAKSTADINRVVTPQESSSSPHAFQAICDKFQTIKMVETNYSEEKVLQILDHPLLSRGTLIFSPEQGIYRHMKDPFEQEILMTRSRLIQHTAGESVQEIPVRRQPVAQAFVEVMMSFFSGDRQTWEKYFEATFTGTEAEWKIQFIPRKGSPIAIAINRILLEGSTDLLASMTVIEKNGDATRTLYSNQRVFRAAEGEEALHRFPLELKSP